VCPGLTANDADVLANRLAGFDLDPRPLLCPRCAMRGLELGADLCDLCADRKALDPDDPTALGTPPPVCLVPSCINEPHGHGLCSTHLKRLRDGRPMEEPIRRYGRG
jgi:hypothetical protein